MYTIWTVYLYMYTICFLDCLCCRGVVPLWFAGWTLDCFEPFPGLLYCDTTVTVSFSTQVRQWVPENLMLGESLWWTNIVYRGGRIAPSLVLWKSRCWALAVWNTWPNANYAYIYMHMWSFSETWPFLDFQILSAKYVWKRFSVNL